MYLLGGRNQSSFNQCLPGVMECCTESYCWNKKLATGSAPIAIGFTVCATGKRAFTFGGVVGCSPTNNVHMLTLDTTMWLPIKCTGISPSPRYHHGSSIVNGIMFVFGGSDAMQGCYDDIFCFDTATLTWIEPSFRGLPPSARAGHTFVAHRDKDIYMFGGHTMDDTGSSIYKYSVGMRKWKQPVVAGIPPPALRDHVAFVHHSSMYVLGGIRDMGMVTLHESYVLRFINPSERKPIAEHLIGDFCTEQYSLSCWSPTKQPAVSYKVDERYKDITDKRIKDFVQTKLDFPLCDHVLKYEAEDVEPVDVQLCTFRAASAELSHAKQALENEKIKIIQCFEKERVEVERLVKMHKRQNEAWWFERRKENDVERQKLRKAWERIESQREILENERRLLGAKGEQVARLLQQINT
nr:rab9 effector protein with kelch motifs-like isoform X2 [Ciona intestinalis]|eukprot:XP_026691454.1 rab9 effector protein with kelch motifs-like isoform X2 [Ciona intestinalis]